MKSMLQCSGSSDPGHCSKVPQQHSVPDAIKTRTLCFHSALVSKTTKMWLDLSKQSVWTNDFSPCRQDADAYKVWED